MNANRMKMFFELPNFETKRLFMRKMLPSDADDMYNYAKLEEVTRYLLWSPHTSPSETRMYLYSLKREYAKGRHFEWALIDKQSSNMIGTCGFTRIDLENSIGELGYVLNPEFRGKEIALEACLKLISLGFDYLGLERIEVRIMEENAPSLRVAQKCGMTLEGVFRNYLYVKGKYRNIAIASILKQEYYKSHTPLDYSYLDNIKKGLFDSLCTNT